MLDLRQLLAPEGFISDAVQCAVTDALDCWKPLCFFSLSDGSLLQLQWCSSKPSSLSVLGILDGSCSACFHSLWECAEVYTGNYRNNKFHGVVWSCLAKVFSVLTSRWPWRIESRCSIHVSSFVIVYCCRPPGGRLPVAWRSRIPGHVRSTACRSILACWLSHTLILFGNCHTKVERWLHARLRDVSVLFCWCWQGLAQRYQSAPSHHTIEGEPCCFISPLLRPHIKSAPFQRHPKAVERC